MREREAEMRLPLNAPGRRRALLNQGRMPIEAASEYFSRFASQPPEHRPFGHPYYWAAFTFSGA